MKFDKKHIANIIQTERRKAGLKQAELAEKIGISEKHLSKIETGKNYPALDTFLKIIDVLNLTLADFGFHTSFENNSNKLLLQKIINNSSEKQINTYTDVIVTLQKHI